MPDTFFEIETYSSFPCKVETFIIKGKRASEDDFGESYEGNRRCDIFNRKSPCKCHSFRTYKYKDNKDVADKYGLNEWEYNKVCEDLEDTLSVGACEWCG